MTSGVERLFWFAPGAAFCLLLGCWSSPRRPPPPEEPDQTAQAGSERGLRRKQAIADLVARHDATVTNWRESLDAKSNKDNLPAENRLAGVGGDPGRDAFTLEIQEALLETGGGRPLLFGARLEDVSRRGDNYRCRFRESGPGTVSGPVLILELDCTETQVRELMELFPRSPLAWVTGSTALDTLFRDTLFDTLFFGVAIVARIDGVRRQRIRVSVDSTDSQGKVQVEVDVNVSSRFVANGTCLDFADLRAGGSLDLR